MLVICIKLKTSISSKTATKTTPIKVSQNFRLTEQTVRNNVTEKEFTGSTDNGLSPNMGRIFKFLQIYRVHGIKGSAFGRCCQSKLSIHNLSMNFSVGLFSGSMCVRLNFRLFRHPNMCREKSATIWTD